MRTPHCTEKIHLKRFRTTYDEAEDMAGIGKIKTSQARELARNYRDLFNIAFALADTVADLNGGPIKKVRRTPGTKEYTLREAKDYRRSVCCFRGRKLIKKVEQLIMGIACIQITREYGCLDSTEILFAPADRLEKFNEICDLLNKYSTEIYTQGYNDGKNLLVQLASGSLSVNDFNKYNE